MFTILTFNDICCMQRRRLHEKFCESLMEHINFEKKQMIPLKTHRKNRIKTLNAATFAKNP